MKIKIIQGNNNDLKASDINVVIDVIRAFTVAHYAFIHGTKEIFLVNSVEEGFNYKQKNPQFLLAGEVNGLPIEGFDLDNSPLSVIKSDLQGKTLIQKTTNGVKGTLNSLNADAIFVTGFTNARTTARYIHQISHMQKKNIQINIIASHPTGDDDLACAEYIKSIIENKNSVSAEDVKKRIENSHVAAKFYDDTRPEFNREDISLCTRVVDSNFVMKVNTSSLIPKIERINI
ncbi:2-phosphosulfolactate phosphatase [Evansella vedderi]|uniref:Probable 2-phosphosulfolactate phosphatase n=1 Tax=Evansella vedderi TaxID=38282 RepID=A0ABU0A3J3_9BACI|nr:2-phosphosulfolactate phosphatase [Evansella vedderi]MDQ0258052.1 2-phosphosulfolactate phosphatase [Evansella vedderi]